MKSTKRRLLTRDCKKVLQHWRYVEGVKKVIYNDISGASIEVQQSGNIIFLPNHDWLWVQEETPNVH